MFIFTTSTLLSVPFQHSAIKKGRGQEKEKEWEREREK
jgi:hypothetical protein